MCVLFGGGWGGQREQSRLICTYLNYTGSSFMATGSIYGHVLLNLLEGVAMASR